MEKSTKPNNPTATRMAPAIIIQWGYSQSSRKWSILAIAPLSLFPLHLQRLNRFGLFNLLGENQPSFSRRSELFVLQPVTCGFYHFAVGNFPTFGCGQQGHDFFAFSPSSLFEPANPMPKCVARLRTPAALRLSRTA